MRLQFLFRANEESSELLAIRNSHLTQEWPKDKMRKDTSPKNPMKAETYRPGFTLVEFLISFTLVTLLLTGTAQLTIHTLLIKRNADLNMKTAELASSFLEYLKSLPYESDVLKEGSSEESIKEDCSPEKFHRKWTVKNIAPNMKRIEVECFSENRSFKKTRLVLYLSKELGF